MKGERTIATGAAMRQLRFYRVMCVAARPTSVLPRGPMVPSFKIEFFSTGASAQVT
jgi:hypothetical protein